VCGSTDRVADIDPQAAVVGEAMTGWLPPGAGGPPTGGAPPTDRDLGGEL
jgi:hypothetical protein